MKKVKKTTVRERRITKDMMAMTNGINHRWERAESRVR